MSKAADSRIPTASRKPGPAARSHSIDYARGALHSRMWRCADCGIAHIFDDAVSMPEHCVYCEGAQFHSIARSVLSGHSKRKASCAPSC